MLPMLCMLILENKFNKKVSDILIVAASSAIFYGLRKPIIMPKRDKGPKVQDDGHHYRTNSFIFCFQLDRIYKANHFHQPNRDRW